MKKFLHYLPYIFGGAGLFFLGVLFGLVYKINATEIQLTEVPTIEKENLSVVELTEISPFGVKGKVQGNNIRLVNGEKILEVKKDEEFQINTAKIFRNIAASIPEGSLFFSSARGKSYYPVSNTKQLEKVRPENLVFFGSVEEAVGAGYREGK